MSLCDTELTVSYPLVIKVGLKALDSNGLAQAIQEAAGQACGELLGQAMLVGRDSLKFATIVGLGMISLVLFVLLTVAGILLSLWLLRQPMEMRTSAM